jgi:DNA-binding response OmpR family regulator
VTKSMITADAHTTRILVVDDETDLVELVTYNFTREGYKVSSAADGEEALDALKSGDFGLIILDLMLPGLQGNELCRIIRNNPKTTHIPIIMLTAKNEVADRVQGLETGADDYMAKPFSPRELIVRANAVLRRGSGGAPADGIVRIGSLRINKAHYSVSKGAAALHLSATEFALLLYLAERKGRVFGREQLLDAVWRDNAFVEPRTVDVHIRRLRLQIEDNPGRPVIVKTRRGIGYYVDDE